MSTMNQYHRHEQILKHLSQNGFLSVADAGELLDASPATLRRDFNQLAKAGLAQRTHGGLRRVMTTDAAMLSFEERDVKFSDEKAELAAYAANLLEPGDTVIVDGGTTTSHLARCLPDIHLRIITNSLRLAAVLNERRVGSGRFEVLVTGGYLYPASWLLVGPQANANLAQYHAKWAFLSAAGVCLDGVYNTNEFVAESERTMIASADRVVLMADHSKLGAQALCHVCPLESLHLLITDSDPSTEAIREKMAARGVAIEALSTAFRADAFSGSAGD